MSCSYTNYDDIVILEDDDNDVDLESKSCKNPPLHLEPISLIDAKTNSNQNDKIDIFQTTEVVNMLFEMTQLPINKVKSIVTEFTDELKRNDQLKNIDNLSAYIMEHCLDEILAKSFTDNKSSSNCSNVIEIKNDSKVNSINTNNIRNLRENDEKNLIVVEKFVTPLSQVLDIFPLAKISYIEELLQKHSNNYETVVQNCMEKGYEKIDKAKPAETIKIIDYMKISSFQPSLKYQNEAYILIQNDYPYISVTGLRQLLQKNQYHYAITLDTIEKTIELPPYEYNRRKIISLKDISLLNPKLLKLKLKYKQPSRRVPIQIDMNSLDPILFDEIQWIRENKQKALLVSDRQLAEKLNEEMATAEGQLIECGCCYAEYPFENVVQCSEGHLFCKECLQRYVETTVFGDGRSQIKCLNTGNDECDGYFPEYMLKNSLSDIVYNKYQEALVRDAIKTAKIENMCTCHDCSMQVEMAEDAGNIMVCPSCSKETCRLCGEESHIPLRCEEVEKKGQTEVRLTVEEAMTQARIRQCPKCKTRFYKTEGCNKMTCSCGTKICYICRVDITVPQYAHFCQTPLCNHSNCGKCKLFTDSVEDDRLAMYEAGSKALMSGEANQSSTAETRVQLEKLLEGGKVPVPKKIVAVLPQPPRQQNMTIAQPILNIPLLQPNQNIIFPYQIPLPNVNGLEEIRPFRHVARFENEVLLRQPKRKRR